MQPPPPDAPEIGWRVEFRPTEVQLTDFENAAYTCFVVLLTRVIISFRLTFLIPISKVNENMGRAQKRDAVLEQKFWFRRGLQTCNRYAPWVDADWSDSPPPDTAWGAAASTPPTSSPRDGPSTTDVDCTPIKNSHCTLPPDDYVVEMSIEEIICGKTGEFPGLIKLIKQYLDSADVDVDTRCTITQYLNFIQVGARCGVLYERHTQKRATGEIWTMAHWIREFVRSHADYKKDSVVSEKINYDLIKSVRVVRPDKQAPDGGDRRRCRALPASVGQLPESDARHGAHRHPQGRGGDHHWPRHAHEHQLECRTYRPDVYSAEMRSPNQHRPVDRCKYSAHVIPLLDVFELVCDYSPLMLLP